MNTRGQNSYLYRQMQTACKWLCYALLLYAGYILQTSPGLFAFFGIKAVWLVAVCVCATSQEDMFSAAFFGAFGGLLWDLAAGRLAGFFAVLLLLCCFGAGFLFENYFRQSRSNCAALSAGVCGILLLTDLLFNFILPGATGILHRLFFNILPVVAYTGLVGYLCFPITRRIHQHFKIDNL